MKYSIIISFYQNVTMLWNCLHVLFESLHGIPNVEVLIVNDNPQFNLNEVFSSFKAPCAFRVIQLTKNLGHSGACNEGWKQSRGEYLVFMDCDIIVSEGWLIELEKIAAKYKKCGGVASTILDFATNQVVYFGMELYKSETIKPFQGAYRRHPFLFENYHSTIVTSGCLFISRAAFTQVNGFDETFYNSCNDLDLSMKLNAIGYDNYVAANSIVFHRGNVSGNIRFASHIYARSLFFQKWGKDISAEIALTTLKRIYSQQSATAGDYLIIDFSSSLFSSDYINCLCAEKAIHCIDKYVVRMHEAKILLTDYLHWDISQLRIPILYFVDDYRNILSNYLWFQSRGFVGDLIADRNGNLISVTETIN